jgi:branched-chain amino acid transport system ATP-binding protein
MLLKVEGLNAGYGDVPVLRGLNLTVREGEQVGVFGPNGHGKTTLLRTISGLLRPTSGSIGFDGRSMLGLPPRRIVELGLIHVPQGSTLFPRMTVEENLLMGAYPKRARANRSKSLRRVFELFPRLAERRSQQCRTLSGGERQMAALGVGLMGEPRLLMLDEPTLGLAPVVKEALLGVITQIAKSGTTLLIVDQDINLLLAVCVRQYLVEHGQASLELRDGEKIREEQVLEMYFGKAAAGGSPT